MTKNKSLTMESVSSRHFKIFFTKHSVAEIEIGTITSKLEAGYKKIIRELKIDDKFPKIRFYLYPTRIEKVKHTGEKANANTDRKNFKIFALYNKDIKPVSPHEVVHILTNSIGHPNYVLNEGLAESFSETWKIKIGKKLVELDHDDWVRKFIADKKFIPIFRLFDDSKFWDYDPVVSYPECGSFVKYLRKNYSLEQLTSLVRDLHYDDAITKNLEIFKSIIGKSLIEVEKLWLKDINAKAKIN